MILARWIRTDSQLYNRLNGAASLLDGVFHARPILLLVIWTMTTAGLSAFQGRNIPEFYWSTSINWLFFPLFSGISLLACSAAIKGNNDKSEKAVLMLLLTGICLSLPAVWAVTSILGDRSKFFFVGGWISLFYVSWRIYFSNREKIGLEDWTKTIPFFALPAMSLIMIGWHLGGGEVFSGIRASAPYVFGFVAVALISPLSEKAELVNHRDLMKGTLPLFMISLFLLSLATALGYIMGDPIISTSGAIVVPFYLVALLFPRAEHIIRAFRYPLMILAIFLGVRYPWLLFAMFLNFTFVRWYNYFRFGTVRPTLKVVDD